MSNVKINIIVDGQNVGKIDEVSGKLKQLSDSAASAGKQTKAGLADIKAGFDMVYGSVRQIAEAALEFNALGTSVYRANVALDSLSGSQGFSYVNQMREATKGLVSDFSLAQQATKALGLRVIDTSQEAAQLAKYGAILGTNFLGSASQGVETLTLALSRVGLVQLLDNIGLSGERVRNRFNELKKTMSDQDAWTMAVFQDAEGNVGKLEKALDGVGSAAERNLIRFENLKNGVAEWFATGVDEWLRAEEEYKDNYHKSVSNYMGEKAGVKSGMGTRGGMGNITAIAAYNAQIAAAKELEATTSRTVSLDMTHAEVLIGGAGSIRQMTQERAKYNAELEKESAILRASGLKGGFGLSQTGTDSEVGGMLDSALGARRQAVEQGNGRWRSQKQKNADLAEFDSDAKQAQDAYALATGAATLESLKFRDVADAVTAALVRNKMSALETASAYNQMSEMVKGGYASMQNMQNFERQVTIDSAKKSNNFAFSAESHMRDAGLLGIDKSDKTGHTTPSDPFAPYGTSADTAITKINAVKSAAQTTADAMAGAGLKAASGLKPIQSAAGEAAKAVAGIGAALRGMTGTLTINVGFSGSGGGGRTGGRTVAVD